MKLLLKYKVVILGVILGSLGGYIYYYFVGCASGTCTITSHPLNSTLYGAFLGGVLFSGLKKNESKNEQTKDE